MVHNLFSDTYSTSTIISERVVKDQGCSLVFTPSSLWNDAWHLLDFSDSSRPKKIVSIVICTYGRPESLNETLQSLSQQTYRDFEVILLTERGDLSVLRDRGLRASVGDIVSFIDDDVYCPPTWLEGVIKNFGEGVVGVTGPTTIPADYQKNRDSIRYKGLSRILCWMFKVPPNPGSLSVCGAPSMASNFERCNYEGEVEYRECCNMSVKRKEAIDCG